MKNWVKTYDMAEICSESKPTQKTIDVVNSVDVVVTSSLKRAIDSAKLLGTDIYESNAIFNEASIPDVHIAFLKFKAKRVFVRLGLSKLIKLFRYKKWKYFYPNLLNII